MQHEIREDPTATVVAFNGDVDLDNSREARDVLLKCVGRGMPILVDLSAVTYIDSSGVAALVESLQTARKRGCELSLVSASESCMRVLQLARLDKVFPIFPDMETALAQSS